MALMMVISTMLLLASAGADPNVSAARRQLQTLPFCICNFDGDSDVDVNDLLNVLSSFMVDDNADTDNDGDTDIVDLLNVLAQFGQECHEQHQGQCDGWDFHMTDTYGDGWNCASADITDCEGNLLVTGVAPPSAEGETDCNSWTQHDAGAFSEADLCLPDADGYTVSFTSGYWDGEIGWSLLDADGNVALSGGAPGSYTTCPPPCADNEVDFHMTDTYGNGWDCAYADIYDCAGNLVAAEVAPPNAEGEDCTSWTQHDAGAFHASELCLPEPDSTGYWPVGYTISFTSGAWDYEIGWSLVYNDGTVALSGGAPDEYTTCPPPCTDNEWDFHMTDTYGDGWNCATANIYDCQGNLLAGDIAPPSAEGESDCNSWTQHDAGAYIAADLCLPDADGYTVIFTPGAWDYEIGWSLLNGDGEVALAGGAFGDYTTCPFLCGDAASEYAVVNEHWDFHMTDESGDGWNGNLATIYNCDGEVAADGVTLGAGSTGAADVCLPPADGYGVVVGGGSNPDQVGWTLLDPTNATILIGSAGAHSTCDSHTGCPSAGASNYNPIALIDDGSCDHTQYCNSESFDYEDGASVTEVATDFACWSGDGCADGAEVAYIENGAMRINAQGQDIVSNWPEVTSGQHYISFTIEIASGGNAYYNLGNGPSFPVMLWDWELQVYFYADGSGHINTPGDGWQSWSMDFDHEFDTPILCEMWIDVDAQQAQLVIGGQWEMTWAWVGALEGASWYGVDEATNFLVDDVNIQSYGDGSTCGAPAAPADVDCDGSWSFCDATCPVSTYSIVSEGTGFNGAACEFADGATQACLAGQGDCVGSNDGSW